MNSIQWNKQTLKRVKGFPKDIKKEIGYLLFKLQVVEKLQMPFSRYMSGLGKNCYELRVRGKDGVYRVFYLLKVKGRVIVFHAFQKKSQKTLKKEIEIGIKNLQEVMKYEKEGY